MKIQLMKKTLAIILSVVMIFSVGAVAFAADSDVTPVIIVSGMAAFPLVSSEDGEQLFPPQANLFIKDGAQLVFPLTSSIVTNNWDNFATNGVEPIHDLFAAISCDENGDSKNGVTTSIFPESADNYKEVFEDETKSQLGMVRSVAEEIGWENTYYFHYDWRLSPLDHAKDLRTMVERAKSETGSDKVSLFAMSMGGTITSSYLYEYGSEDIENIVYGNTAFLGTELVGRLFNNEIDINIADLLTYFKDFACDQELIAAMLGLGSIAADKNVFNSTKSIDTYLDAVIASLKDAAYSEVFMDTYATFLGIWALIPSKDYDSAKQLMKQYGNYTDEFIAKCDEYIYNVQDKTQDLIKKAEESGTNVYIIGSYGFPGIPLSSSASYRTDYLIDTCYMTGNCTIAPYGKTISEGDYSLDAACGNKSHNHFSTDGVVFANGLLPDRTWVIDGMKHVEFPYGTGASKLAVWVVTSEGGVDVYSNNSYPQFTKLNRKTGTLSSLTEGIEITQEENESSSILDSIIAFFKGIFQKILSILNF